MVLKAPDPQHTNSRSALYLRSVCGITTAFHGLRCHPLTCMSLNLRLSVDSIPSALLLPRRTNKRVEPILAALYPSRIMPLSGSHAAMP